MEPILVSMAECKVTKCPAILSSVGVGSCIAVVLYDPIQKIGGLAHIMLPSIHAFKNKSRPGKFADAAIKIVLEKMETLGARKHRIRAKIFGGANMFPSIVTRSFLMNIGERNAQAVREELGKKRISIVAEEIGGNFGRTVFFDLENGKVRVKNIFGEERIY